MSRLSLSDHSGISVDSDTLEPDVAPVIQNQPVTLLKFIRSDMGKQMLVDSQYYCYSMDKKLKNAVSYKCQVNARSVEKCKGRIHLTAEKQIKIVTTHNHAASSGI